MASLNAIIEGRGDLDMINDLLKLHDLFIAHPDAFLPLKKFSNDLLVEALDLNTELWEYHGKINTPESEMEELDRNEKQALTHLLTLTNLIRKWAKLTFGDQPEILEKFRVTWMIDR